MMIEKFTTNYYKILAFLYDNKIFINQKYLIPLTHNEVSEATNINRTTVNSIFKELKEFGLIEYDSDKQGRYFITSKGIEVVKKISSIKL